MRHTAGAPSSQGVEWFSSSATSYGAGAYTAPTGYSGASTSGYGTTDNFEDEPPLLEGVPQAHACAGPPPFRGSCVNALLTVDGTNTLGLLQHEHERLVSHACVRAAACAVKARCNRQH